MSSCGCVVPNCSPCKQQFAIQFQLNSETCVDSSPPLTVFRTFVTQPKQCTDICGNVQRDKHVLGYVHGVMTTLQCSADPNEVTATVTSMEAKLVFQFGLSMLVVQVTSYETTGGPVHMGVVLASTCLMRNVLPNTPVQWTVQTDSSNVQTWNLSWCV